MKILFPYTSSNKSSNICKSLSFKIGKSNSIEMNSFKLRCNSVNEWLTASPTPDKIEYGSAEFNQTCETSSSSASIKITHGTLRGNFRVN